MSCCKVPYRTKVAAGKEIDRQKMQGKLRIYFCKYCKKFHLTSEKEARKGL